MNAIRSSVRTSSRCVGHSFATTNSNNRLNPEKGDLSDGLQIALAFSTITIIGPGILLLINEIFQTLFNEPKKREEQLEIACHVAFENIKSSNNGTEPRSLEFRISTGNGIRFTEQANGVYVQHDDGVCNQIFDKLGKPFKTLDDLQSFRRKDISDNKIDYDNLISTDELKELFKKARAISILSTTKIDGNQSCMEDRTVNDLTTIDGLTRDKIEQAYNLIQEAPKNKTTSQPVYTGMDSIRLSTEPLFTVEKNWRWDQDSESSFETSRGIYNLTNAGEAKIAAYYNKKYFQCGKKDSEIIVTKTNQDFKIKLSRAISDDSCRMAGFLFRVNPSPDAHPTPIVFEKKDGEFHFFISDSMIFSKRQYQAITDTLMDFPGAKAKLHISSASESKITRQADNGSCHSDALYYLQRALRLGSMCEHVTIRATATQDAEYDVFEEPADLLLTAQTSGVLTMNKVNNKSGLKLGKPDEPRTFEDKTAKYNGEIKYSGMKNPALKKKFKNKGFLSYVNQKHHSILMKDDYV